MYINIIIKLRFFKKKDGVSYVKQTIKLERSSRKNLYHKDFVVQKGVKTMEYQ